MCHCRRGDTSTQFSGLIQHSEESTEDSSKCEDDIKMGGLEFVDVVWIHVAEDMDCCGF